MIKKEVGKGRVVNRRAMVGLSGGALVGKTNGRVATLVAMRQAVAEGAGRRAELGAEALEFPKKIRGSVAGFARWKRVRQSAVERGLVGLYE